MAEEGEMEMDAGAGDVGSLGKGKAQKARRGRMGAGAPCCFGRPAGHCTPGWRRVVAWRPAACAAGRRVRQGRGFRDNADAEDRGLSGKFESLESGGGGPAKCAQTARRT